MSDKDPAFLWETAAIRSAPQRVDKAAAPPADAIPPDGRWVTLREANQATGIPVETLRKWARRGTVPTYLAAVAGGTNIRMVDLDHVEQRGTDLGRTIQPVAPPAEHPPAQQTDTPAASSTPAPPSRPPAVETPPPGTMIIPVDAWNKMLNQLGNLHQAGQQLAEAKERAAKAETEATFLRERLAELRGAAANTVEESVAPAPPPVTPTEPEPEPPASSEKVWQYLVRRARGIGTG